MLIKSGFIVAFYTLISRIFGLIREFFIAALFGTTWIGDSVNVAFKFPNLFRRIFGEGALSAVFVPMYNEKIEENPIAAENFSNKVLTLLICSLFMVTLFVIILMPYLFIIIAPGFYNNPQKFDLAVTLCRITSPYLIFISVTALMGGMLNSYRKYFAFAVSPVILNIFVISITYYGQSHFQPSYLVAYSLIIAGICQLLFMIYSLKKINLKFRLNFKFFDKEIIKLVLNMGPATVSYGSQQLALFISQSIASFIPGAISILAYADRLYQLPLALTGSSLSTILLPELSRIYKKKHFDKANYIQNKAIIIASLLSLPAMIGILILAEPIVHIIYERGEFTSKDTLITANVLIIFSLAIPAYAYSKILTPIFYANLDTKTPLKITLYSLISNIILNIIFMIYFSTAGIAIGSTISSWLNFWLLNKYAKKYGDFKITSHSYIIIAKIIVATIVMLAFLILFNYNYNRLFYSELFRVKFLTISIVIISGALIYFICLYFMGVFNVFKTSEYEKE